MCQWAEIAFVGSTKSLEINPVGVLSEWGGHDVWERKFVEHSREQHAADPSVEVAKRVNPLKAPVYPSQEIGKGFCATFKGPEMA